MSESTPGPWVVSSYEGGWTCIRDDRKQIIAKLGLNVPANAHLIAQAWTIPALREALEDIAADAAEFEHGDTNAETFVRGLASKARAALKLGQDNG